MAHVKKNDTVRILSGKDRGKEGAVLTILTKKNRVVVKGCAIVTKHAKARRQGEISSIKKIESHIALSNVMLVCSSCKHPCRTGVTVLENGKRARTCVRCKAVI